MLTTNLRKLVVLVAVLTGMAAVGVVSALAASSAAPRLELTIDGKHEPVPVSADYPFGGRHRGTFTSGPPFCASGSLVDLQIVVSGGAPVSNRRLFTCGDGTGTLTLSIFNPSAEHDPPFRTTWTILEEAGAMRGSEGLAHIGASSLAALRATSCRSCFEARWMVSRTEIRSRRRSRSRA